jgi:hypothetical protein
MIQINDSLIVLLTAITNICKNIEEDNHLKK